MTNLPTPDDTHELVFLVETLLNEGKAGDLESVLPDHLAFLRTLFAQGRLLFGGPLVDDELNNTGTGVYVLRADSLDAAEALAASDPLHDKGIRRANVRRWMWKNDYSV